MAALLLVISGCCGFSRVQNHRKTSIRLAEVEAELANRVGELVLEGESLKEALEAQKEEVELAKQRVQHAEQAMATFKDRIEADYVSRQQVLLAACSGSCRRCFCEFSITWPM